jgi:hypothetical protein
MDCCGHLRGFLSLRWTLVDGEKRGVPKGGLARACLLALTDVLLVLHSSYRCPPENVVVCSCPSALLSGCAVNLILDSVIRSLSSESRGGSFFLQGTQVAVQLS